VLPGCLAESSLDVPYVVCICCDERGFADERSKSFGRAVEEQ